MTANRIAAVRPLTGRRIELTYTGGRTVAVDLSGVIEHLEVFAPLESAREFKRAAVGDYGWSVEWPCGASLDSDRVLEMALEQAGQTPTLDFRRWQDSNALSLADAAAAIGMTRRTISQYRTGARPVPRVVALACIGWEAQRKAAQS